MKRCPSCGRENAEDARFCSGCGFALEEERARKERKVVTVLFCDLVGSTRRAEDLDPEDVGTLLGGFYALLRSELERFGGTVEKFIGDAVMAVFGAPTAHEDDPERAVRAALAIRERIMDEEGGLEVRVSVNTGEALVSLAARPSEGEGMVAGDVVNTAARLQAAAPANGIFVGEVTYRATERAIEYRQAGPVQAKGKVSPIPVWEALATRSRLGADLIQRGRPLVGRERELAVLSGALERARAESAPQVVTLVGVPGIGKSRLVYELLREVEADRDLISWRQGRCLPYGEGISFWALGEMVKAQAGILETDTAEEAEQKLGATVMDAVADEAAWVGRHLRPLVGLASEGEVGSDARSEAFAAWRRFFESLAGDHPLVLTFEDIHWADEGLLAFIDHLVEWASSAPLLCLCTARPELLERRPGWGGGKLNATTIALSPLSDAEIAQVLAGLFERALLPAETHAALLAAAAGNPLYAEEFGRMLGESPGERLRLPESVQGILAARIDSLPPEEKLLLQGAAVLGKVFWSGALGEDRAWAEERLHALERKEFVRRKQRSSVGGETEYAFRHVLVRDVAYGEIPRAERAEKHRRAAAWIESLSERSEDHAEMVAHHYLSALEYARAAGEETADLGERARLSLREAGERALSLNAFATAAGYFSAALELWPLDDPDRAQLLFGCGKARFYAFSEGEAELTEAVAALPSAGQQELAAEAQVMLGLRHADQRSRMEHFERALAFVRDAAPSRSKAEVLTTIAGFFQIADEPETAKRLASEALAIADALGLQDVLARAQMWIGILRLNEGDAAGSEEMERSLELLLASGSPFVAQSYGNLADSVAAGLGDLERCFSLQASGLQAAERFGISNFVRHFRSERVVEHYYRGRWDEAVADADAFIAEVEAHPMDVQCYAVRSAIRFARGDVEKAEEDSASALERGRAIRDPQALYPALGRHARVLLAAGRRAEAGALIDEYLEAVADRSWVLTWGAGGLDLVWSFVDLRRKPELVDLIDSRRRGRTLNPWGEVAVAILQGDFGRATDLLGATGARPEEAYARLRMAERLVAEGRPTEADAELELALAFHRSVGATHYVREGEALLAASA